MAMRTRMDLTKGLCYKLRTMGIPIKGPTLVFFNNKSVVTSTYVITSNLAKKHLGICYHVVREANAVGIYLIVHIAVDFSAVGVLTKLLAAAVKRPHIGRILY